VFKRTRFIFHADDVLWSVPTADAWQLPESLLRAKTSHQPDTAPENIGDAEILAASLAATAGSGAGMVNGHPFFNRAFIGLSPTSKGKRRQPFHAEIVCDGRARHLHSTGIAIGIGRYADEKAVMEMDGVDPHQLFFSSRAPLPWLPRLKPAPAIGRCGEVAVTLARQIQIVTDEAMTIVVDGKPVTRTPATFTFFHP
jgi:diacylglycerol kinase family enzyme